MGRLTTVLSICLAVILLSSCSKINICGKEDKLYGAWEYTSLSVGDSNYLPVVDAALLTLLGIDSAGLDTIDFFNGIVFLADGTYYTHDFIGPGTFGTWRMDRYETDCLIYLDGAEFRWQINSLSDDNLDVNTFAIIETDSLVDVNAELVKFEPEFLAL